MKAIFDKPFVFDGDDEKVVLVYSNYIVGDITKEDADLSIEKIHKGVFDASFFESAIKIEDIFEYEFEPENDTCIMFGIKNNDGTSYRNIEFKDIETVKRAEQMIKNQFELLGFKT